MPTEFQIFRFTLLGGQAFIAALFIFASIKLMRTGGIGPKMMLVGAIVQFILCWMNPIVNRIASGWPRGGEMSAIRDTKLADIWTTIHYVNLTGGFLFAIGLLLCASRAIKHFQRVKQLEAILQEQQDEGCQFAGFH